MRRKGALALVACALLGAGAWWWTQPDDALQASGASGASPPGRPFASGAQIDGTLPGDSPLHARTSAGKSVDSGADPLLQPGLRDALEALLHAAGDAADPDALKQRLEGLVGQHFPPELATRALALAHRYVDYRVALGQLRAPADLSDPRTLRNALEARQKVRLQYFDSDEFDALFAQEMTLDQSMLARLEIERNNQLTPEQKRRALQAAEEMLDPAQRALRAEAVVHVGVAQQTAAFNAQGIDDSTRHALRSAQHGTEAAQRLAQLDQEERDWNARLDQYQQARSSTQDATRLQQLRGQLFSPEEQLRIEGALALRAQPATAAQ
ncbi:MAG: lipase secretion chaperone [Gammaproteobacteria bacterium]